MKIQLGHSVWRISSDGSLTVVIPCGSRVMFAARVELFNTAGQKSVSGNVEIYERGDMTIENRVRNWMVINEEESTNN